MCCCDVAKRFLIKERSIAKRNDAEDGFKVYTPLLNEMHVFLTMARTPRAIVLVDAKSKDGRCEVCR